MYVGHTFILSGCKSFFFYAAGDVTTVPYKQIIISMGEGAKAALTAFDDRIRGVI
ncbi:hypothetical protein [Limibacterium fermenti]|uniref:hypothetical protein n=1 Tax=Limibacterium fermenti TaxID=3229863 RepID=UPI003A7179D3